MIKSALIKDYLKQERGYKYVSVKEIEVIPALTGFNVSFHTSETEIETEFIYQFDLMDFAYSKIIKIDSQKTFNSN